MGSQTYPRLLQRPRRKDNGTSVLCPCPGVNLERSFWGWSQHFIQVKTEVSGALTLPSELWLLKSPGPCPDPCFDRSTLMTGCRRQPAGCRPLIQQDMTGCAVPLTLYSAPVLALVAKKKLRGTSYTVGNQSEVKSAGSECAFLTKAECGNHGNHQEIATSLQLELTSSRRGGPS